MMKIYLIEHMDSDSSFIFECYLDKEKASARLSELKSSTEELSEKHNRCIKCPLYWCEYDDESEAYAISKKCDDFVWIDGGCDGSWVNYTLDEVWYRMLEKDIIDSPVN